jgi:hypothetical protein
LFFEISGAFASSMRRISDERLPGGATEGSGL